MPDATFAIPLLNLVELLPKQDGIAPYLAADEWQRTMEPILVTVAEVPASASPDGERTGALVFLMKTNDGAKVLHQVTLPAASPTWKALRTYWTDAEAANKRREALAQTEDAPAEFGKGARTEASDE